MLILLPPSETKRDGGDESRSLDLAALSFPSLTRPRRRIVAATRALSRNRSTMAAALGLGPTQLFEVDRNRSLWTSPVLPALERYTGVLFDALDVASLPPSIRSSAAGRVVVHSAMFGLLGADDLIPAYRLSHDSRLPEMRLATQWRQPVGAVLDQTEGLLLDLRSEAYVHLGPVAAGSDRWSLRVVSEGPDGVKRSLNHVNKKGKGSFVRSILQSGEALADVADLLDWARSAGIRLTVDSPGELELTVDQVVAHRGGVAP